MEAPGELQVAPAAAAELLDPAIVVLRRTADPPLGRTTGADLEPWQVGVGSMGWFLSWYNIGSRKYKLAL